MSHSQKGWQGQGPAGPAGARKDAWKTVRERGEGIVSEGEGVNLRERA